ncbi:MAG: hypothetical protein Q9220_006531 [cf. Caloplaca sp. 1 TL-2023]
MVVFWPRCDPVAVIQVFSTIALTANLTSMFHYDFNVGSLAQFGNPTETPRFDHRTERTDFRDLSHLAIRQRLDVEGFTDDFILVDEHTLQSHAIWWIVSTQDSQEIYNDYQHVTYQGENQTLWQTHILIQDFAYEYDGIAAGDSQLVDFIPRWNIHVPYDPHDPQEPPFTTGDDYAHHEGALPGPASVWATFPEIIFSNDWNICRYQSAPWCVALTREAAKLSGLLSPEMLSGDAFLGEWSPWEHWGVKYDRPPRPGDEIKLRADYDWDNPRWPAPGIAGPFPGPTGSPPLTIGRPSQQCVRRKPKKPGVASPSVATSK